NYPFELPLKLNPSSTHFGVVPARSARTGNLDGSDQHEPRDQEQHPAVDHAHRSKLGARELGEEPDFARHEAAAAVGAVIEGGRIDAGLGDEALGAVQQFAAQPLRSGGAMVVELESARRANGL